MKKHFKSLMTLMLALLMALAPAASAAAAVSDSAVDAAVADTAAYLQKTVAAPTVGSIGGEWGVLGLARSSVQVPDSYYENYYNNVVKYVQSKQGVLHDKKYTEYSRVILALTAIGKDPANVGGYNLLTPLGDYEKTVYQGINGAIFALIALDSNDYAMPQNPQAATQASRDMYVQYILDRQLPDGGWALGTTADADVTGMALQALANYRNRAEVKSAVDKGLACLSAMQNADGSFDSWGSSNCESVCQAIVALGCLDISLNDSRFVKNDNTLLDALLSFYTKGGGFRHTDDAAGGNNLMATEQGFYALVAADRAADGKNSLYDMSDVKKSGDVTPVVSFPDVQGHKNQQAIEALTAKEIINGMPDGNFLPNATMTRAEFAAIVVRALELNQQETAVFRDVKSGAWYSGWIGAAYQSGIVKGTSADLFTPNSTITREEAATMVARAAAVLLQNSEQAQSVQIVPKGKELMAQANDGSQVSAWAETSVAYCLGSGIMESGENIQPQKSILRCEIAQMIYNMLGMNE